MAGNVLHDSKFFKSVAQRYAATEGQGAAVGNGLVFRFSGKDTQDTDN